MICRNIEILCVSLIVCFCQLQYVSAQETLSFSRYDYFIEDQLISLVLGDYNSDDVTDIAVLGKTGIINIFLGEGDGAFSNVRKTYTEYNQSDNLITEDFNLDGIYDLIIGDTLYFGSGIGYFHEGISLEVSPSISGDVNSDGKPDLLWINSYDEKGHTIRNLKVNLGNGDGTFSEPFSSELPGAISLYLVSIDDFNSDEIPDVIITYQVGFDENGPLFKYTSQGYWFNVGVCIGQNNGTFSNIIETTGFSAGYTGDFNNDGNLDFIGGIFLEPNVHLLLGDGMGNFSSSWQSSNVDSGSSKTFILDSNNNNFLDIGVIDTSIDKSQANKIIFFMGTSEGISEEQIVFEINGPYFYPPDIEATSADFNNDGYDDFVIAPYDSTYVSVFINSGSTTFIDSDQNENPRLFHLYQNTPNPFNNYTIIKYWLEKDSYVDLNIYDVLGREIQTFVSDKKNAGSHYIQWDGTDDSGNFVASGVYLCKIGVDKKSGMDVKKIMFLK